MKLFPLRKVMQNIGIKIEKDGLVSRKLNAKWVELEDNNVFQVGNSLISSTVPIPELETKKCSIY